MTEGPPLPPSVRWVIVGAGVAGAATAWGLARAGLGPGLLLEREYSFGVHASGRNAGLMKLGEEDPVVRTLAVRCRHHLATLQATGERFLRPTGGLTIAAGGAAAHLAALREALARDGLDASLLDAARARARLPLLDAVAFDIALWCPAEGVLDVHALLTRYLHLAREAGFLLRTQVPVDRLLVEGGRVTGVETPRGRVRAETVIDACGAWAGRLGREARRLRLQAVRRHLVMSGPIDRVSRDMPFVWVEDGGLYFKPEGDGLLLSPCDETPMEPCLPDVDPAAVELLAEKLAARAPGLGGISVKRSWACLRTFAPDRRPLVGFDPDLPGLFHVSGLGGFGMMTGAAVGELAAAQLAGHTPDWIDLPAVAPGRAAARPVQASGTDGRPEA